MLTLHEPLLAALRQALNESRGENRGLSSPLPQATAGPLRLPELAGREGLPELPELPDLADLPDLPTRLAERLPVGVLRLGGSAKACFGPKVSFAGSRVALLAHWSENGQVAPYVLYYLSALKAQGWRIVFVSGGEAELSPSLRRLCDAVAYRLCPGYDFTSWKAALELFPSLFEAEELLFTNDSIFAPIGPLAPVHAAMDKVPCDFWGLVASREFLTHLQSYYLVFRASALRHPAFAAFWDAVGTRQEKRDVVLHHEVVLTPWLAAKGLCPAAYVLPEALPDTNVNPAHYFWRELCQRYHVPIIKRDLLRDCREHPHLRGWEAVVQGAGYDVRLIHDALKPQKG